MRTLCERDDAGPELLTLALVDLQSPSIRAQRSTTGTFAPVSRIKPRLLKSMFWAPRWLWACHGIDSDT